MLLLRVKSKMCNYYPILLQYDGQQQLFLLPTGVWRYEGNPSPAVSASLAHIFVPYPGPVALFRTPVLNPDPKKVIRAGKLSP